MLYITIQGQIQVYVQVYNWDIFGEKLVDDIIQDWSIPDGDGSYSRSQTFKGQRGHVTLTTRIRVMCSDNYDGPYCSHFCGINGCQYVKGEWISQDAVLCESLIHSVLSTSVYLVHTKF